jgi:hypothetical protein
MQIDKSDVCVPRQDAIAVYRNLEGGAVIAQFSYPDDEDAFVVVNRPYIATVIERLQAILDADG